MYYFDACFQQIVRVDTRNQNYVSVKARSARECDPQMFTSAQVPRPLLEKVIKKYECIFHVVFYHLVKIEM
jgi:hypothetical protein